MLAVIDVPELEKDVEEAVAAVEQSKAQATLAEAKVATAEAEREAVAATMVAGRGGHRPAGRRTLAHREAVERIKDLYARDAVQKGLVDEQEHEPGSGAGRRALRRGASALTAKAQQAASAGEGPAGEGRPRRGQDRDPAGRGTVGADPRHQRLRPARRPLRRRHHRTQLPPGAPSSARPPRGRGLPLLTVMRTDRMRVVVQVPDLDVALLDVGDPATVVIDALKGRSFTGRRLAAGAGGESHHPDDAGRDRPRESLGPALRGDVRPRDDRAAAAVEGALPSPPTASSATPRRGRPRSTSSATGASTPSPSPSAAMTARRPRFALGPRPR